DLAGYHCDVKSFGENSGDSEFVEWFVEYDIAGRFHGHDFGLISYVAKFVLNGVRLPQSQFAVSRTDADRFDHFATASIWNTFSIHSILSSTIVLSSFR